MTDFLPETKRAKGNNTHLPSAERKEMSPQKSILVKTFFRNKEEIKAFSDEGKQESGAPILRE